MPNSPEDVTAYFADWTPNGPPVLKPTEALHGCAFWLCKAGNGGEVLGCIMDPGQIESREQFLNFPLNHRQGIVKTLRMCPQGQQLLDHYGIVPADYE